MESIKELKQRRADIKSAMKALVAKETDDAPMGDDDVAAFNGLKDRCEAMDARIARLEAAADDAADEADEASDDVEKGWQGKATTKVAEGVHTFNINTANECRVASKHAGERTGRWLVGAYYAKNYGVRAAKDMVEKTWGDDMVAKAIGPLTTSQPVIPQDFNPDWVALLNAKAVIRQLGPTVYPMPNGNMTIPRQRVGSTGAFFGEGTQITVSNLGFDNLQLSWHKYGAMTYTSRELLEFTPLAASSIIANDLSDRLALLEDRTFLIGSGSGNVPHGISTLVNSNNIIQNTGGGSVTFQTVSNDLQAQELQMTANLVTPGPDGFAYVFHPAVRAFLMQLSSTYGVYPFRDELATGRLNGHKVYCTTQLATNIGASNANLTNIILCKPEDLIIGDAYRYAISMTTEGSFVDGATQVNPFGQDLVAWKCTNAIDFAMKHDVSACVLQAAGWSLGYTQGAIDSYSQTANTSASSASSAVD